CARSTLRIYDNNYNYW
nr:immunoglobulin heavy chain junction region [Macaca mulatta]MOV44338.1 immunoglobulin heavy chain junction region [Macaca mulatta]MOV46802.1 immunoglobulin heavy chain junction region [Macaca mulatta]MOV47124.1 immunoglobulin heavy chain junction region [Macaca mulatta]